MNILSDHDKGEVTVVMPIYKNIPSEDDLISIKQCQEILKNYPLTIVKPSTLSLEAYPFTNYNVEEFNPLYFNDIAGYNKLMMSSDFYKRFLKYRYMLVYQTDAFVFSDQLSYWCEMNYDYIGSPWLYREYVDKVKYLKERIRGYIHRRLNIKQPETLLPTEVQFHNVVGNGGFSLRKVEVFFNLCRSNKGMIDRYLLHKEKQFNEDVFFSIEINRYKRALKKPHYKKALFFSIESYPTLGMRMLQGNMPFGCHGWEKQKDFWRPFFEKYNVSI